MSAILSPLVNNPFVTLSARFITSVTVLAVTTTARWTPGNDVTDLDVAVGATETFTSDSGAKTRCMVRLKTFFSVNRECVTNLGRLIKQFDNFRVNFEHFRIEHHF